VAIVRCDLGEGSEQSRKRKEFAVAPYPASVSTPDDRGDDAGSEHKWEESKRPLVKVEITTVDFAARSSKPWKKACIRGVIVYYNTIKGSAAAPDMIACTRTSGEENVFNLVAVMSNYAAAAEGAFQ
jgi:hypothetical protein